MRITVLINWVKIINLCSLPSVLLIKITGIIICSTDILK